MKHIAAKKHIKQMKTFAWKWALHTNREVWYQTVKVRVKWFLTLG